MIARLGRFPGEGKGYPLQYSGLKNSMDCIVHGVSKSWTRLSDCHFHLLNHTLQISLWLIFGELMFNFRACICQYPYGARLDCVARLLCCCLVISHIGLSPTPWTVAYQAPLSTGFPRQEYWMGCHSLLQGICPTQGSNPWLLNWQMNSSLPSHLGSLVQFRHSVVSYSLRPYGLQHARIPCPSPTPGACSNLCPSSH